MLESTKRLYAERIQPEIAKFYGEMYFRLILMLGKIGIPDDELHAKVTAILDGLAKVKDEERAVGVVSSVLGGLSLPADAHESRANYLARLVGPHVLGRLLDFGCGDGQVSVGLSEDLMLYDISDFRVPSSRAATFTNDWNEVKSRDGFDSAIVLTVLHHCDEPNVALDNVERVSGRIIIVESVVSRLNPAPVQAFVDWFWNRGLHPGVPIPVPGNFRTDDEWQAEFSRRNLTLTTHTDLGIDLPGCPEHHVLYVLDK